MLHAMAHDKKRRRDGLRWALPHDIGDVRIVDDVPLSVVKSVLHEMGGRGDG
jgi:3-dehydroquinate synthetase